MKIIRVTMPDGSRWDVPAHAVADNRARYYSHTEGGDHAFTQEAIYAKEYDFTMTDRYELLDWAASNMNWEDVAASAKRVEEPPEEVDYQEGWLNGEKEIVDIP